MHMSSQRYINAASEYKYICIPIYNTFCSATFYNDPPMITHAVAQELGPQEVKCDKCQQTKSCSNIQHPLFLTRTTLLLIVTIIRRNLTSTY